MSQYIRATHWAMFRSGEWAKLKGITDLPGFSGGERECYLVEFSDGAADFWPVTDPDAGYEFR